MMYDFLGLMISVFNEFFILLFQVLRVVLFFFNVSAFIVLLSKCILDSYSYLKKCTYFVENFEKSVFDKKKYCQVQLLHQDGQHFNFSKFPDLGVRVQLLKKINRHLH